MVHPVTAHAIPMHTLSAVKTELTLGNKIRDTAWNAGVLHALTARAT
ncbi:MAG: hypothetical protein N2379_02745 [Verrucomicrobiae bacterium]|nr:hypothetical protein [Verrucomicrobiae bacterium]